MTRARLVSVLSFIAGIGLLATGAFAQPAGAVRRIGYLGVPPTAATEHLKEAFLQGLREHGWLESRNLIIERRYFEGFDGRLHDLAMELVRLKVEVVITLTTAAALAARKATDSIPIVMVTGDPVDSGLAASYARPGSNVTGLTHIPSDEWFGKLLALLKEAAPRTSRVAVIWNSANQPEARGLRGAAAAARVLRLTLVPVEVRSPEDFDAAFATVRAKRVDAIFAFDSALNFTHRQRIADFAARHRMPTVFGNRQFAEAGGLLSYSASLAAQFRRAAYYVDRTLRGARPSDLPIERPSRFELVLNMKTAKALGLAIPSSILAQADEVIQ